MKNSPHFRVIVEESKKFFSEAIKDIYYNKLTFKQWRGYFNILKAAIDLDIPTTDVLNFAQALNYAHVLFITNDYAKDCVEYTKSKEELQELIKQLQNPKISVDNKSIRLK